MGVVGGVGVWGSDDEASVGAEIAGGLDTDPALEFYGIEDRVGAVRAFELIVAQGVGDGIGRVAFSGNDDSLCSQARVYDHTRTQRHLCVLW